MATNFPTSLDTITNPAATDSTKTVSHSQQHANANDAIEALEAKVGVNSSAVTSSLDYKLTNTSSSNPGHKHTLANGATDVTASAAEVNVLDGIPATLTATELGYVDGVTSAIQTQLDGKEASITTLSVAKGGSGRGSHTAYAVICGGTDTTTAQQSIASVGSSGQVLTSNGAGALPTFEDASGGSSSSIILDTSNVVLPDTNFPSLGKKSGTNWLYKTLDFDPSTDEAAYWNVQIPSDISSVTTATLILYWTASSGTASQVVYWDVVNRTPTDDEVLDATTTPSTNSDTGNTDTLLATNDLHKLSIPLTITNGWSPGDMVQLKLSRDANNGSDTLTGDAKLIMAVLEIR